MIFVLLDTNVVLDYAGEQEEFSEVAEKVFETIKRKEMIACVSASAVTDIFYFLQKWRKDRDIAMSLLKKLLRHIEVLAVNRQTVEAALESGMWDFEDAVQAAAASDYGINTVVTRDKKGFTDSGLKVYSPEEFLEALK